MKSKFNFNLKLTLFLVSLFVGLLLVILGNKNKYCLSFGLLVLSLSMVLYALYHTDKTIKQIKEMEKIIDEIEEEYDQDTYDEEDQEAIEQEKAYAIHQISVRQSKLRKRKKSIDFLFYVCAALLASLALFGIF